jgi:hypothetical protein
VCAYAAVTPLRWVISLLRQVLGIGSKDLTARLLSMLPFAASRRVSHASQLENCSNGQPPAMMLAAPRLVPPLTDVQHF